MNGIGDWALKNKVSLEIASVKTRNYIQTSRYINHNTIHSMAQHIKALLWCSCFYKALTKISLERKGVFHNLPLRGVKAVTEAEAMATYCFLPSMPACLTAQVCLTRHGTAHSSPSNQKTASPASWWQLLSWISLFEGMFSWKLKLTMTSHSLTTWVQSLEPTVEDNHSTKLSSYQMPTVTYANAHTKSKILKEKAVNMKRHGINHHSSKRLTPQLLSSKTNR